MIPKYLDVPVFYGDNELSLVAATEKLDGKQYVIAKHLGEYHLGDRHGRVTTAPFVSSILTDSIRKMLRKSPDGTVIYGQLCGPGVSKLTDYGLSHPKFFVFDISINGVYLGWSDLRRTCRAYSVSTAPLLYLGFLSELRVDRLTSGPTMLASASEIKGITVRLGAVIRPTVDGRTDNGTRYQVVNEVFSEL